MDISGYHPSADIMLPCSFTQRDYFYQFMQLMRNSCCVCVCTCVCVHVRACLHCMLLAASDYRCFSLPAFFQQVWNYHYMLWLSDKKISEVWLALHTFHPEPQNPGNYIAYFRSFFSPEIWVEHWSWTLADQLNLHYAVYICGVCICISQYYCWCVAEQ